ncbi:hypothetical protein [Pseudooceanicola sp.]|uniref:hypothetical protein n=1 Tax=Pseudooceanicola sp. TaxID=1914328 RepID=UPI0026192A94|nr:hypothetical protein [Pseudooceanicola sp.]MDF1855963.1 hypothetical protein [Pseudooceanicola sp.]
MTKPLDSIRKRIASLQEDLEVELAQQREKFRYRVENGKVRFEAGVHERQKELREGWASFLARTRPSVVMVAPVIYSLIVPFVIVDIWVSLYQAICFPVYGIEKAKRGDYIRIDRHRLAYLNWLQKLNCVYCGYVNGLIAYIREVAGRTEAFWCPIKHAERVAGRHGHYQDFVDYGDAEGFAEGLAQSRETVRSGKDKPEA